MISSSKYPMVYIVWNDSSPLEIPSPVVTLGFLIKETDDFLYVTPEILLPIDISEEETIDPEQELIIEKELILERYLISVTSTDTDSSLSEHCVDPTE